MTKVNNTSVESEESKRPVFLCYRQADGKRYARWVFSALEEAFKDIHMSSEVYFDQAAPAVPDWKALHGPSLERARAMIVICTPGICSDQGEKDWVHNELNWWLRHRSAAPIIVDTASEVGRWIPEKLKIRWPNAQRVNLDPQLWAGSSPEELAAAKKQVLSQIMGGIEASQSIVIEEDLTQTKRLNSWLQKTAFSLAVILFALLGVVIYAVIQRDSAVGQAQRAFEAEKKVRRILDVALAGESDRLLERGKVALESDPSESVLLAEAATQLNPNVDIRDLLVRALYHSPSWARFPKLDPPKYSGELFPDVFDQKRRVFVTDRRIRFVLVENPTEGRKLDLYDVDQMKVTGSLILTTGESVIAEEPIARDVFAIERSDGLTSTIKIFEMTPEGLGKSIFTTEDGTHFATANGSWPAVLCDSKGNVNLLTMPHGGNVKISRLGTWPDVHRVSIHPQGRGLLIFHGEDRATWLSVSLGDKVSESRDAELRFGKWYLYQPDLPWICWGTNPNQIICLEPSWPRDHTKLIADNDSKKRLILSAIDVRTGKRQILRETSRFDSGIGRPVLKSDLNGRRVLWVVDQSGYGMVPEVLTLKWLSGDGDGDGLVKLEVREEGQLHGYMPAQSMANIQTAEISPNGNYAIISSDIRGTSGTQSGRGMLESWGLTDLDIVSSGKPDAAKIPIPFSSHVLKLAYSADSSRIAALDERGSVNVFNVRYSAPPTLSLGFRIPEALEKRLSADVCSMGIGGRYWLVTYTESDHRLYDLADGSEHRLEKMVGDHPVVTAVLVNGRLLVGSKNQVVAINLDTWETENSIPLPDGTKACIASSTVFSTLTESQIILTDAKSMREIGRADIDECPDLTAVFPEGTCTPRSAASRLIEYCPGDKKLRSFSIGDDWLLTGSEVTVTGGDKIRVRTAWTMSLPYAGEANRWHSIRRLVEPNILLLLVGTYNPDHPPVLSQYSGDTGREVNYFDIPKPKPGNRFFEILDALPFGDKIAISFRYYPSGFGVGIWAKAGGAPLSWNYADIPKYSKFRGSTRFGQDEDPIYVWGSDDDNVSAFSTTAQKIWTGKSKFAWPYLSLDIKGECKSVSPQLSQRAENRIREGGGGMVKLITTQQLAPEERNRISVLTEFIESEGNDNNAGRQ